MKSQKFQNNQCGPENEKKGKFRTAAMPTSKHTSKL